MEEVMFQTYSTAEAAKMIGIDRHLMPVLAETKILQGIKIGRGRRYSEEEIREFWNEWKGSDLSNAEMIRMSAALRRTKKGDRQALGE